MTTVLIVEDDPMIQHLLGDCFARGGCWVLQAGGEEDARMYLGHNKKIDVVLLDGNLRNKGSGKQVAHYIVREIWPQQRAEWDHITAFVTMSHDPFPAFGASHIYGKRDLVRMLVRQKDGCAGWICAMKAAARQWAFAPVVRPFSHPLMVLKQ